MLKRPLIATILTLIVTLSLAWQSHASEENRIGSYTPISGSELTGDTLVPSSTVSQVLGKVAQANNIDVGVPNAGDLWYPDGFWAGPHEDDMMLAALTLVFGEPVTAIYNIITGKTTELDNNARPLVTLTTAYAKIMNSIGMVIILAITGFSLLGFLVKRSVDVSYLTPQKEEIAPFMAVRGSLGVMLTFPIAPLGGMSVVQGLTIGVVLMGIGFATSIIRFSIPYIVSPAMVLTPTLPTNDIVDFLVDAKMCAHSMAARNNVTLGKTHGINKVTLTVDLQVDHLGSEVIPTKRVRYDFGASDDGKGNECGTIHLNDVQGVSSALFNKNSSVIVSAVTQHKANAVLQTQIDEIWASDWLHSLGKKLSKTSGQLEITETDVKTYIDFRNNARQTIYARIVDGVREEFQSPWNALYGDSGGGETMKSTINAHFEDKIANVGFMGLGAFYTMLTQKQTDANENLNSILRQIDAPSYSAKTTASNYWSEAWRSVVVYFGGDNSERELEIRAKLLANQRIFYDMVDKQYQPSRMEEVMNEALDDHTNPVINQWSTKIGGSIIQAFRASDSGGFFGYSPSQDDSYTAFPNPILEMRSVGNAIVNTSLAAAGISVVAAKAAKTSPTGLIGSTAKKALGDSGDGGLAGRIAGTVLMGMLGIGIFYAYIVPNLPYIMWSIAVFSYLSFVVMAVMGAGWWGGALASGMERNLHGRSALGGQILVTLAVQPLLMTISFFVAMVLNLVLGYYLHWTIESAAISALYGGFNILSFLMVLVINGIVMLAGVLKNMSIIWELTEKMIQFLGMNASNMAQGQNEAQSEARSASGSLTQNIKSIPSALKPPTPGAVG